MKKYLAILLALAGGPFLNNTRLNAAGPEYYYLDYRTWDHGVDMEATVLLNGKTYLFDRPHHIFWYNGGGETIRCQEFLSDTKNGQLLNGRTLTPVIAPGIDKEGSLNTHGTTFTTCVYKGKIYVFYDAVQESWWWGVLPKRMIKYKYSSNPENGWSEEMLVSSEVFFMGYANAWGQADKGLNMTAAVIKGNVQNNTQDKMYLFFQYEQPNRSAQENKIFIHEYNGEEWRRHSTPDQFFEYQGPDLLNSSIMSAQAVTMYDREAIAIVLAEKEYLKHRFYIVFFDGNSFFKRTGNSIAAIPERQITLLSTLYGATMPGITNANVLHIFISGAHYANTEHWLYNLTQGYDGNFERLKDEPYGAVLPALSYAKDDQNIRQYISFISPNNRVITYPSDYFKFLRKKNVNTLSRFLKEQWTLVGVIDGVPPFPPETASSIGFSKGSDSQVGIATTYSSSNTSSFVAGYPDIVGAGPSHTDAFSALNDSSETLSDMLTLTFENNGRNVSGELGKLIFQAPDIVHKEYELYASDKITKIANMEFVYVDKAFLITEEYSLANPKEGMTTRPKSSNFKDWNEVRTIKGSVKSLELPVFESTSSASGSVTGSSISRTTTSNTTTNDSSFSTQLVFLNTSSSDSVQITSQTTSSITNSLSMSMSKLPPSAGINILRIRPYLLIPEKGEKQDWVPSLYRNSNPWCLTWSTMYE